MIHRFSGIRRLLCALALSAPLAALAQAPAIDPAATAVLKRMSDYLGSLKQFSVDSQNVVEDLLDNGQRADEDIAASVTVSRPNKLRAERKGELINQSFYYDGKTLTLYQPGAKVYATAAAPLLLDHTLLFAQETLGIGVPGADLLYSDPYPLLMFGVKSAAVVGKAVINGVKCDQLAFSSDGVDFQVWVAEGAQPLPRKYVITDTGTPQRLSITTVLNNWNLAPNVPDSRFVFVPPQGAKEVPFVRADAPVPTK